MVLSHEDVGLKILAKIKIYLLTRAELLCSLCNEIPCTSYNRKKNNKNNNKSRFYPNFNQVWKFVAF